MVKITMIGAGSIIFCKHIIQDIMTYPALKDSHIALMDIDERRLDQVYKVLNRVKEERGLSCTFSRHTDRAKALDGANFVISMIQVGGLDPYIIDIEIPLKYGIDQCVGDTLGPGGIFRGLRHVAVLADIIRDVDRYSAKDVIFINYCNPMAICTWAIRKVCPEIESVGICHGVQYTTQMLCNWLGVPYEECDLLTAGINHMAWFLSITYRGKDLYPRIWEKIATEGHKPEENFRFEMMKATGYFMTETSGHLSEYLPYFRNRADLMELFSGPGFMGESGAYLKLNLYLRDMNDKMMSDWASGDSMVEFSESRSIEFAAPIMNAKVTGSPVRIAGNVLNNGLIENLPAGCCVEVPVFVDSLGLHPVSIGKLPEHCAALCRSNISVQELALKAALEGDKEAAFHACLVDPLTAAVLAPHEIRNMVDELFAAQDAWLPQFKGKENSTPSNTIGRRETSDFTVNRGRAMMDEWKPHEFDPNNIIYFL